MRRIGLDGAWALRYFPEGGARVEHPEGLAESGAPCIAAEVPGNAELDLVRAGLLPEPFYGENIFGLRPWEFCEWWYSRSFEMPDDAAGKAWELVFGGLDTIAEIWVNGQEAGRADNMLVEHRVDISGAVRPGMNTIAVRIASAMRHAEQFHYDASLMSWERREEGVYLRKAPHMWGWDIMPRAVSAGIWRSVWVEERAADGIEQLYYWSAEIRPGRAVLGVRFKVRTARFGPESRLSMRFRGVCGDHVFTHDCPIEFIAGGTRIAIAEPELWWPKGYGAPALYTVTARLYDGETLLAERTERIGLRSIRVDRTPNAEQPWMRGPLSSEPARIDEDPAPAARFVFYVNDTPIMVKGANWVPLDAFHSRDAGRVRAAVELFEEAGCNMIRCWGGNVYEDHAFFDLCDEKGLLVWQDFAFACCRYPQDEAFLGRVRREAEQVVEKLRNHVSLALWCGDNEIDGGYTWEGLNPENNRLTREVLPQVTHRCDPYRHYVPSSPYIPEGDDRRMAEQHLWGPRGYYKSPYYTLHSAHFIGEIGYHGCPGVSSIKRFIPPEHLWPWQNNPAWRAHNVYHWRHGGVDRDRIQLMANQIREVFGDIPERLEEFALASQIVQAEAKKFFVESARLRKWRTSGILWWNMLDGWPQFSDAVVDYYFVKKLAYHYLRRAQQPVCVVVGESAGEKYHPVVLCNDTRGAAEVTYRIWNGETEETVSEGTFNCPANQNWQVGRIRSFASGRRLLLIEWRVGGVRYVNHYLEGAPPFSMAWMHEMLEKIAALDGAFAAAEIAG